jgi:hypothetical protein
MATMGVTHFKRFFREAASLDVDKNDVKRHGEFVSQKIYDLLLIASANAKANQRDVVEPRDLPITKGLQETIGDFRKMSEAPELEPILADIAGRPYLDITLSEEAEARLPELAGALSLALARTFRIVDPEVENPQTEQWNKAFRVFRLLL